MDIFLFILFCVVVYIYLKRKTNYWALKGVPCEKQLLFFGNIFDITFRNDNVGKYIEKLYNKFDGPYFGFTTLTRPYLVIKDPDILKRIIIKDFNAFPNRFFVCDAKIDPVMSYSLLGIKNPQWRVLRRKLSPIFSSGKIKMMMPLIKSCAENLARHIRLNLDTDEDVRELAAKYTTDVISTCAFGIEANSFVSDTSEIRVAARKMTKKSFSRTIQALSYSFAPILVKIFRMKFFERDAVAFLSAVFKEAIQKRESTKTCRNDLIDILISLKGHSMDDDYKFEGDKIVAQALMFFFAGHDATSSTISFVMHQLCIHSDIQARLRNEIVQTIERNKGVSYDAVQEMKYLQQVISESLRLYVVTPFLQREALYNYEIPETGLVIESGTSIIIPQHGLHNDPKYFNDPQKFDPERFSDANKHSIPSCVYLPFGEGPRNCVGERFGLLSVKLGIIYILKEFLVIRNTKTLDKLVFSTSDLLRTATEISVTFKKIN